LLRNSGAFTIKTPLSQESVTRKRNRNFSAMALDSSGGGE